MTSGSATPEQPLLGDGVATEQLLLGGGLTVVTRVGATVRRPMSPWSPAVHQLLRHLADVGFDGAPRVFGIDDRRREILDFIPGDVPSEAPLPVVRTDLALVSAARLLRRYHDASVGLLAKGVTGWQLDPLEPAEVLCHGDVAPYNTVYRDGRAVALLDFDFARPGPRAWDLAYALYRFAPLAHPDNPESYGVPAEQARRARLFLDAYDASPVLRSQAVAAVVPRLQWLVDHMRAAASDGNAAFAAHVAAGHTVLYNRDTDYILAHTDLWEAVVVGE